MTYKFLELIMLYIAIQQSSVQKVRLEKILVIVHHGQRSLIIYYCQRP